MALGLTCAIEVPLFLAGCAVLDWIGRKAPLRLWQAIVLVFAVNVVTHPLLWLIALRLETDGALLVAEAGVVVVEALITWVVVRRQPGWALLLCLGTNAASLAAGLLFLT